MKDENPTNLPKSIATFAVLLMTAFSSSAAVITVSAGGSAREEYRTSANTIVPAVKSSFTFSRPDTVGTFMLFFSFSGTATPADLNVQQINPWIPSECQWADGDFYIEGGGTWSSASQLGMVILPAGQSSVSITITPLRDSLCEDPPEIIQLNLQPAQPGYPAYGFGTQTSASISLLDGPSQGADAVARSGQPTSIYENSSQGVRSTSFDIKRWQLPCQNLGAQLKVDIFFSGSATYGSDYSVSFPSTPEAIKSLVDSCGRPYTVASNVIIQANAPSAIVTITATQDGVRENHEDIRVSTTCWESGLQFWIMDDGTGQQPLPPSILSVTYAGTAVALGWTPAPGADGYYVKRMRIFNGNPVPGACYYVPATGVPGTTVNYWQDNVPNPGEYVYSVVASSTIYGDGPFYSDKNNFRAYVTPVNVGSFPSVTLSATDADAGEPANQGAITVTRSASSIAPLVVNFIAGGTAKYGVDYDATGGYAVIFPNQSSIVIPIIPRNDSIAECAESVTLSAITGGGYSLGSPAAGTVTISDDDRATAGIVWGADGSENGSQGSFDVTIDRIMACDVVVNFSVSGTATPGSDYSIPRLNNSTRNGTAVILAGTLRTTVPVNVVNDTTVECQETVVVTLTSSSDYSLPSPSPFSTINISDNEFPTVSITLVAGPSENGIPGTLCVSRGRNMPCETVVNYTVSGSATPGASGDFTIPGLDPVTRMGSVTIGMNQSGACVNLWAVNDSLAECAETITFTLGSGSYNIDAAASTATTTVADNDVQTVSITPVLNGAEAGGNARFQFSRASALPCELIVSYTVAGTATAGTDYTAPGMNYAGSSGTITIPADQTSVYLDLNPVNDSAPECLETAQLTVVSGAGYQPHPTASTAATTISDNDLQTITITAVDNASEVGAVGTFRVNRAAPLDCDLEVNYTVSGDANPGSDYTISGLNTSTRSGKVTILSGQSFATVLVNAVDDLSPELSESLTMTVAAGTYQIGTPATATIQVLNDPRTYIVSLPGSQFTSGYRAMGYAMSKRSDPTYGVLLGGSLWGPNPLSPGYPEGPRGMYRSVGSGPDYVASPMHTGTPGDAILGLAGDLAIGYQSSPDLRGALAVAWNVADGSVCQSLVNGDPLGYAKGISPTKGYPGNITANFVSVGTFRKSASSWGAFYRVIGSGSHTELPGLAGSAISTANAINEYLTVVGASGTTAQTNACVWKLTGGVYEVVQLPLISGASSGDSSEALAINSSGNIVGYTYRAGIKRPTLWTLSGSQYQAAELASLNSLEHGEATDINDSGVVVGTCSNGGSFGCLWADGRLYNLTTRISGSENLVTTLLDLTIWSAMKIDNRGWITGTAHPNAYGGSESAIYLLVPNEPVD